MINDAIGAKLELLAAADATGAYDYYTGYCFGRFEATTRLLSLMPIVVEYPCFESYYVISDLYQSGRNEARFIIKRQHERAL